MEAIGATGVAWGAATHPGRARPVNEDAVLAEHPAFVVADGMGGHAAGEVASALVSDAFRDLAGAAALGIDEVQLTITRACEAVAATAASSPGLADMGTTLVGLVIVRDKDEDRWLAFNIGDSRLYRWFGGVLTQVTRDHSEAQQLVDDGMISPEAARSHPWRHAITRSIGGGRPSRADLWLLPMEAGERYLLCSDGLNGELADEAISATLAAEPDPTTAAERLVAEAVQAAGRDNVTAVVVDYRCSGEGGELDTLKPERG